MAIDIPNVRFQQFWPVKHMHATGGLLPETTEAAALWRFLGLAFPALYSIPRQATLEGRQDQEVNLKNFAHAVQMQYDLKDWEGMFNPRLIELAKREAARCGMSWDDRIDAWFESGGKSYDFITRDPDKVGL